MNRTDGEGHGDDGAVFHRLGALFCCDLPRLLKVLTDASWRGLGVLLLFQVFAGVTPSVVVWLNSILIDRLVRLGGRGPTVMLTCSLVFLVAAVLLLNAIGDVLETVEAFVADSFKDRAQRNVSFKINEKIANYPSLDLFDDPRLCNLLALARRSMSSVSDFIHLSSHSLIGIFGLIPALLLAATLGWWIPLMIILSMIPLVYVKATTERKSWDVERSHAATFARLQIDERVLTHQEFAKDLRLFNMQGRILQAWERLYQSFLEDIVAVRKRSSSRIALWSVLSGAGLAVPFIHVMNGTLQGKFSVGELSLFIGVVVQVRSGLAAIIYNGGDVARALLAMTPMMDFLSLPERRERAAAGAGGQRGIELIEMSFRYHDGADLVLEDVSFSISEGQRIAIVGENGSGKSTLVNLICGLYRPTSGQIRWDGVAIRLAIGEEHRKRVSPVFQDFARFPLSVRENVDARRIADDEEIRAALREVGLGALADDLDRVVWKGMEGGAELSGGQWQRLAIARALLNARSSDLLVFDEPTSALDAHAEHQVMQLIREMMAGKTSIVISHRLALCRFVDRILVLEKGRIVESGSHGELMALKGRYHAMFTMQASYYVD